MGSVTPEYIQGLHAEKESFRKKCYALEVENKGLEDKAREQHDWLYAVWMAFLADEETHELQQVLRNLSAWMAEQQELVR